MSKITLRSGTSWLAIVATQGIICSAAAADPITVSQTINLSTALTQGQTATGMFDINGLLPTTGNYSNPLQLLSATLAVYGYSSPNAQSTLNAYTGSSQSYAGSYYYAYQYQTGGNYTYYTAYNCNWSGYNCSYYATYVPPYYATGYASAPIYDQTANSTSTSIDSNQETLSVTVGADTIAGQDHETVTNLGTSHNYNGSSGGGGYPLYYYYNDITSVDDFISGAIAGIGSLSASTLSLLAQTGTLNYSLGETGDPLTVTQLVLTVTLNQSQAVPEPGVLSIFGFSLLLLALRARSIRPSAPGSSAPGQ